MQGNPWANRSMHGVFGRKRGKGNRVPLLLLLLPAPLLAQDHLTNWPTSAEPAGVSRRLIDNWLERPFLFENGATDRYGRHVHYAEVVTWYGALQATALLRDAARTERLIARFDTLIGVHGMSRISREAHVDFSVFGALPLELYRVTNDRRYLQLGLEFADRQWANASADGISGEARYWADDLYMLPLLQVQAYRATHNRVYIDRAALTMATYVGRLQQQNGLFHHGEGSPFYWGRGNGWVAAGMTELLRSLPHDHPHRSTILNSYRTMMATLLVHQSDDGLWRQLVDRPELWIESSGSAMFAFAMVTGVTEGWLDNATYGPAARRAWLGLVRQLDADGNVLGICVGTGKALNEVGADLDAQYRFYVDRPRRDGDLHGQAPVLWTAAALLRPAERRAQ